MAMLVLVMVLGGCGLAAQSIKTQHPGYVYRVNPDLDFRELRENEASKKFGSVYVGIVLTMRAGNQRPLGGHPFLLMPYSDGLWQDHSLLLRWYSSPSVKPEDIAKRRDAKEYIKQSIIVYKDKLSEGKVLHLFREGQTRVNGETQLDQLPMGQYIIVTSHQDAYNEVEWLVRFTVEANKTTQVFLTNSNATFIY